ncbi:MAG: cation transporter [Methylococcaceae bacterium]
MWYVQDAQPLEISVKIKDLEYMTQTQEYSQFTIAHQISNQIQIIVPSLFQDKQRAHILQILLLKRDAVEQVSIVPEKNAVTINFDAKKFPTENLFNLLEIVLVNFSQKPSESIKKNDELDVTLREGPKQNLVFGIRGMSCTSCALFLEMVLSRDGNNVEVNIDYKTETGSVSGYLSEEKILKIIADNGYQAYLIDALGE